MWRTSERSGTRDADQSDRGSAIVDFVLVSALLVLLVGGLLQLALALHVRSTLTDAAGEGARYAALRGTDLEAGAVRTRELVTSALAPTFAQDIQVREISQDGAAMIEVVVHAPLPVVGLLGPSNSMRLTGRALNEDPPE